MRWLGPASDGALSANACAASEGLTIKLRYGGLMYWDRTLAIQQRGVGVPGVELEFTEFENPGDLFRVMANDAPFDVAEMSLSTYLLSLGQGDQTLVGLPIFLSRNFRHGQIYLSGSSGIGHPQDLRGRLVGVPDYQLTAALWMRGLLADEYDVSPNDLRWAVGGLRSPGYVQRRAHALPDDIDLREIREDQYLEGMLANGDIDALMSVTPPPCLRRDGCRRLFEDYVSRELEYFARTGIFPIMHLVVCKRAIVEAWPSLPGQLLELFRLAKAEGRRRLDYSSCLAVGIPTLHWALEQLETTFGGDAFPYGVEANRATIDKALDYAFAQSLTPRRLELAEVFHDSVLDT